MLDVIGDANMVALIGLAGGIVLGLAARIGRFCTLGAIEDALYSSDDRRLRMWAIAIGTAIFGTQLAVGLGWVDPGESPYVNLAWNPLGSIVGGLMFGYGMALAGNCGYGALARLGGGDLRNFVLVITLGLSSYIAMSGPLARLRVTLFPVEEAMGRPQAFTDLIDRGLGIPGWAVGAIVGLAILTLAVSSREMLRARSQISWAVAVGLAIVSGWIGTSWVAHTGFDGESVRSHTFAAPVGDTIIWAMTASGTALSFSVGSVVGVLIGAALGSWSKGHFRWEACEDPRELRRQILGAALMGPGAILAVGCSIGQGLSAFALLAFSAPVTFAAIFAGAALGLRQLISGFAPAE